VRLGVHTGLQNTTVDELRSLWHRAEASFGGPVPTSGSVCLEAIAAHAALACTTSSVRCGSLVYSVGYRHPAVLANAITTIDHLSSGRAVLGLGAGWHALEYQAYGIPFPPASERLAQLDEAIQCIRLLLTQEEASFEGRHFQLHDARCDPKPVQPRLPIWVGGGGERVTLRIAAQHADGWNLTFHAPDAYRHKVGVLEDHCERVGRDPATITKSVNLTLAGSDEVLRARFGGTVDFIRPSALMGSAQQMVDRISEYGAAGADWVILALRAPFDFDELDRFAADVAPLVQ
jgi:alkanesulfonate monooxygenase SsuD/methylene tetrahydromethanopterin reductase-like flavin-dependent oxidoreductase (luciferase family)